MPSHVLLLRAGYIRSIGAGLYEMLPLGLRVLNKVAAIVREEMDRAHAQELLLPALLPREYFEESGRWETFGATMLRLTDRKGGDYHLGPTHEEIITDLVRRDVKSYKQLPLTLYQVQAKYRDEPRPRAGLLRCREFLMKDAYSFDATPEDARASYDIMTAAYHRIFTRLGLDYRVVSADSGAMGGDTSAEFQVLAPTGEDSLVACDQCDYAANVEVAETRVAPMSEEPSAERASVSTPGIKSIEALVEFLGDGLTAQQTMKSLVYKAGEELVLAVVRGDHEVNETKLARALEVDEVELAHAGDVKKATGAPLGFAGPVGFTGRVILDPDAAGMRNAVVGANEVDTHLRNVSAGRDFDGEVFAIRTVNEGDACPKCEGTLSLLRGIEGGHVFVLGTHYSEKMKATFLDVNGKAKPLVMGCYGIGVSRLVATAVEQNHDKDGICWPIALAPYQVLLTPIGKDDAPYEVADAIYERLVEQGFEVLLDDKKDRPGVKFKVADLLGIPLRVTIGVRGLAEGKLEMKVRTEDEAVSIEAEGAEEVIADKLREMIAAAASR